MLRADNLGKKRDDHGIACQAYKVVSRCIVARYGLEVCVVVGQPIGVDEVCLEKVQAICKKIHHVHKIGCRPAHGICDGNSGIVAGGQHQGIEQVFECQLVA